jgi:predicted RNA-binding protein with PIN domain
MSLLIDGYNLLHASGILARGIGPGSLERTRAALLNFLAESLTPAEAARTIVVFDAGTSATGHVRSAEHRELKVRFSAGKSDADDLIEELIRANSAPRSLVVVSSDHRVQRAALRRRAQAIDSDKWIATLLRARSERRDAGQSLATKPAEALSDVEVRYWLKRFGVADEAELDAAPRPSVDRAPPADALDETPATNPQLERDSETSPSEKPASKGKHLGSSKRRPRKLDQPPPDLDSKRRGGFNPFPPGYAEDVSDERLDE